MSSGRLMRIGQLARRTGMAEATLRAWERRYGILEPQRTESGYRLYSERDIAVIRWLKHKLAEGILKAEPLFGQRPLQALQARLSEFPDALAEAMARHFSAVPVPWKAMRQIVHRDSMLWCREIQVEASYALLLVLCGLNREWFTRFQLKRLRKLAGRLAEKPANLVERLEQVLGSSDLRQGFDVLHALESEVLDLVQRRYPDIDLEPARKRHRAYAGR